MAPAKTASAKKQIKVKQEAPVDELDLASPVIGKSKKPLDLDDPELIPGTEEKIEDDDPLAEDAADENSDDEASIDEEDVNPFGDKWEG